jgi:type IV pilus assembly protein PilM
MATARSAWGIDIGNRALKAIKLVRDADRLRVDDVEVIEHEQILSSAGDNKDGLIQAALANFVQRHAIKGSTVGIAVSGQSSFARFIKLPPVEPKKIPEIVRFEAIQQIPFPLDDVEWSYQLFQDPESPEVEVGIFAMRKELVTANIKQFTDLEMNVQVVQMSPLAIYNGMFYDQHLQDGTTMIVDCGAENTDLIIADRETVWLRTISIGGNNFTEALTKAFKLNFAKAEELKRNAATSKYQRQIFQAMRPVFADLVSEIQRSIGFYGTVHRDSRIKKIIALGSTFRLPTLQKYLQQNLQVDVERIDGFSGGAPSDGRLGAMLNENLLSLGTAYGLAVQAMGDAKITSSLLPEAIRKAKIWKEKTPYFGLAAACFVLGTMGVAAKWYLDRQAYDSKESVRSQIDGTLKKATAADAAWQQTQDEGAPDRKRIQDVHDMRPGWDLWARLTSDIAATVPDQPTLEQTKATPRPQRQQIVIDGISSDYQPTITGVLAMNENDFKMLAGGGTGQAATYNAGREATGGDTGATAPPVDTGVSATARGFLITIHCTTPLPTREGSTFVQQTMVSKLLSLNAADAIKQKKPYFVAKATVAAVTKLQDDTFRAAVLSAVGTGQGATGGLYGGGFQAAYAGGGGGGGGYVGRGYPGGREGANLGRGGERGYAAPRIMQRGEISGRFQPPAATRGARGTDPNDPANQIRFPDPQTGEEMAEDSSLTVLIAVVLDPASAVTTPPVGTNAAGNQTASAAAAAGTNGN